MESRNGLTADDVAFLRSVDSPTIANAVETFGVRDRTEGFVGGAVRSLFPELGVFVGTALTVTMGNRPGPTAERAGYWAMWEALERIGEPSVLVIGDGSGEPSRVAYCGEVMATTAQRLGCVAIVTDGGLRDLDEVRALGMHYHARYAVVSHGNFEVSEVGGPVTLDGQEVRTGDLLHGDANGIVIVPPDTLGGLPAAVREIRERERATMEYVRGEGFSLAALRERSGY